MGIFDIFRVNLAVTRANEEQIYEIVANELADGFVKPGLMAKAISESYGNDSAARSIYIKLRVQSICDESAIEQQLESEAKNKQIETEKLRQEDENTKLMDPSCYVIRKCLKCGTNNRIPRNVNEYSAKCGQCKSNLIEAKRT